MTTKRSSSPLARLLKHGNSTASNQTRMLGGDTGSGPSRGGSVFGPEYGFGTPGSVGTKNSSLFYNKRFKGGQ